MLPVSLAIPGLGTPGQSGPNAAGGPAVIVSRLGDYALVSSKGQYDKLMRYKKLMAKEAGSSTTVTKLAGVYDAAQVEQAAAEPIWIYGNVQAASAAFGPPMMEMINEVKDTITLLDAPQEGPIVYEAMIGNVMEMYVGLIETLMKEVKSSSLAIRPSSESLIISETVSAVPGTNLAGMFVADASAEKENKMLGYLENGAAANFAVKINAPFWRKLGVESMDLMTALAGTTVSQDDIAKMKKLMDDSLDAMGGSVAGALAVNTGDKPQLEMKYVIGVKDAAKFNKMMDESVEMFKSTGIMDLYKGLGIGLDYKMERGTGSYKGVTIDSARLVMKATDPNLPQGQIIDAMYGDGFDYRWGIVDGLCAIAIGGDVDAGVRELIDVVKGGGPKEICGEVQDALKLLDGAEKADFFMTYNYIRLLKMVGPMTAGLEGLGMQIPQVDIPSKSNLAIAGRVGDGQITVDIGIPKQHMAELISAVMIMQQQMMAQQGAVSTKATLATLESAVEVFRVDYPTNEEGLLALMQQPAGIENWNGPYAKGSYMPKDAWNRDFVYEVDSSGNVFEIMSYGADGKEGGEGLNTDLLSTNAK